MCGTRPGLHPSDRGDEGTKSVIKLANPSGMVKIKNRLWDTPIRVNNNKRQVGLTRESKQAG